MSRRLPSPAPSLESFAVLRSEHRYVAFVNGPRPRNIMSNRDVPGYVFLNGRAYGFERATGRRLWTTDLNQLGLQLDQPTETPVLPLIYRSYGRGGIKTDLALFDVRTGRILHQEISKSASSRETRTEFDPAKGEVRVETSFRDYTIRLTDEPAGDPVVTDQPRP